jgi:[ribosomal protein S18]-alanine N-acetyltransferase
VIEPVRRATLADLPTLLEIDAASFERPWTEAGWRSELDGDASRGLVLIAGVLGFACAPTLVDACELRRIAVVPPARGRGLGRDLLAAVIAHARASGRDRIELEVAASNLAALGLYRAAGFCEVGRRPRYYLEPVDDAVLMTLDLQPQTRPC